MRSTVEALFGYGDSRAVVRYTISRTDTVLDVSVRLLNNHPERMFKLCLETVFDAPALVGDTMYAEQPLATDGREVAAQRYVCLREGGKTFGVVNTGSYGLSAVDGALHLSLLRSAGYCAHPILDRPYLPNDRFSDHIDLGERDFAFRLFAGDGVCAGRVAQLFNQPPMALSVFPSGEGEKPKALLVCDSPVLEVSALKAAGDGDGFILRVYNPTDRPQAGVLSSPCYGCKTKITLGRYEVATFRLTAEGFAPQTLNEQACE